jgi:hypothetical protein
MPPFFKAYIFLCALVLWTASAGVYADEGPSAAIDGRIAALQTRFDTPIFYKGTDRKEESLRYEFLPAGDYPALDRYLQLFEEEIRKYPPGFFSKKQIRGIALVRRLFRGEVPTEGAYSPGLRVMLFDVLRSADNEAKQRHSIHHEIFHMMAFQPPPSEELAAANWSALNIEGFVYGRQNFSRRAINPLNRFAPHQLGFVTDYGMESPEEDQAEIFACLMQAKHYRLVTQWQENDAYLRQKVRAIKAFVAGYDAEMGEEYWRRIHQ